MSPDLLQLFVPLDVVTEPLALDVLEDWIRSTTIDEDEVNRFVRFHADHYLRNLMHAGPAYHALVLCWKAGQRSPIHDHVGSSCAVKVIRGVATETRFERVPNGMSFATDSRSLAAGETCASQDANIHQISNL